MHTYGIHTYIRYTDVGDTYVKTFILEIEIQYLKIVVFVLQLTNLANFLYNI